ncbi:MAG: acyl carrier protein [Oxalobacter sp.]|jgi:acyl carrier protein|nr:MAG: acyl carrier protein [Oxalobacter sp.]
MDRQGLRKVVIGTLRTIAPEVEESELVDAEPLRQQVDLDSMDWLNFLIGLNQKLKVEIPEADYQRLVTLDNVLDYLSRKLQ